MYRYTLLENEQKGEKSGERKEKGKAVGWVGLYLLFGSFLVACLLALVSLYVLVCVLLPLLLLLLPPRCCCCRHFCLLAVFISLFSL
jgi:hypothetical protein